MMIYFIKLIFNSGIWTERFVDTEHNQELKDLAKQLPPTIIKSRAASTVSQYSSYFTRWKQWAHSHGKSPLPADSYIIALNLIHLGNSANSPSPIISSIAAISWAHRMADFKDPTKNYLVIHTAEGLKRTLSKPKKRKEPITPEILSDLVQRYGKDNTVQNLLNIRTLVMALISFAGFLRFNELAKIKMGDLTFSNIHLSISIQSSKTDVYRQGDAVIIAKSKLSTCPVAMLELYLKLANISPTDSDLYIFRN